MSRSYELLVRAAIFAGGATVALALFLDFCDLVYGCGCRSWWNGAAEACNIHAPAPPHCPWCATGKLGLYVPVGAILLAQAIAVFWPPRLAWPWRGLLVLALFPLVGGGVALVFGLVTGYWRG